MQSFATKISEKIPVIFSGALGISEISYITKSSTEKRWRKTSFNLGWGCNLVVARGGSAPHLSCAVVLQSAAVRHGCPGASLALPPESESRPLPPWIVHSAVRVLYSEFLNAVQYTVLLNVVARHGPRGPLRH